MTTSAIAKKVVVRSGDLVVNGRLPPEVIKRTTEASLNRLRNCYAAGLVHDSSLQGRVTSKFEIDGAGNVSTVDDGGSDLRDSKVAACVRDELKKLSFPHPESGTVKVTYPLICNPGK